MIYEPLFPQIVNIWFWGDDDLSRRIIASQERYRKTWDQRRPTQINAQGNIRFPVLVNGEWIWG